MLIRKSARVDYRLDFTFFMRMSSFKKFVRMAAAMSGFDRFSERPSPRAYGVRKLR